MRAKVRDLTFLYELQYLCMLLFLVIWFKFGFETFHFERSFFRTQNLKEIIFDALAHGGRESD